MYTVGIYVKFVNYFYVFAMVDICHTTIAVLVSGAPRHYLRLTTQDFFSDN